MEQAKISFLNFFLHLKKNKQKKLSARKLFQNLRFYPTYLKFIKFIAKSKSILYFFAIFRQITSLFTTTLRFSCYLYSKANLYYLPKGIFYPPTEFSFLMILDPTHCAAKHLNYDTSNFSYILKMLRSNLV